MQRLFRYIIEHPEITGGCFKWYDLIAYHGVVDGHRVHIGARVLGEDISIDTDDRAALIVWADMVDGFDDFFTDPGTVRREYTSEDGHRLAVTYYRDQDPHSDTPDDDIDLYPDPYDPGREFATFEDFKTAAAADLENDGRVYEWVP